MEEPITCTEVPSGHNYIDVPVVLITHCTEYMFITVRVSNYQTIFHLCHMALSQNRILTCSQVKESVLACCYTNQITQGSNKTHETVIINSQLADFCADLNTDHFKCGLDEGVG